MRLSKILCKAEISGRCGTVAPRASKDCDSVPAASWQWGGGQDMGITPVLISLAGRDGAAVSLLGKKKNSLKE